MWSIGIYEGDSIYNMKPSSRIKNPIITIDHITDVQASLVADPFMIFINMRWYIFFEVMNKGEKKGVVGAAVSKDMIKWEYIGIVLKEDFHLSYPFVFKDGNDIYMTPETLGANGVVLYKAIDFPRIWKRQKMLIKGSHADPTLLKHEVLDKSAIIKNLDSQINNSKKHIEILKDEIQKREEKISNLSEEVVFFKERNSNHEMEIERLGETSQRILNNVNHELRLPVGNVMNFAEMLSEGLEKYTKEQQKELLDEVLQNSNRLSSMILNMLDLATMNVKNVNLNKQKINISELIEDRIVRCRKIYLQDKPLEMIVSIQPGIIALIDKHYIQQTIDNIIINAIKFSQKGVIKVNTYIENDLIKIIVTDEGIGIPKNELYDIFMPFKMGSNTTSKAEGRGVGLALCKVAVEAHHGTISVESNGYGATFRVLLPL